MNVLPVVILSVGPASHALERARKIAEFLGVEVAHVQISAATLDDRAAIEQSVPPCMCLLIDAETIAAAADARFTAADDLRDAVCASARDVCVFGFQPTERHEAILRRWSAARLTGIRVLSSGPVQFQVSEDFRQGCGPFSSLAFPATPAGVQQAFIDEGPDARVQKVVRAGDLPFLARVDGRGARLFFLACRELADLDEQVGRDVDSLSWFPGLVPLMMFLRNALGDRVWRNDKPKACLIIDDPLLTSRYGFLQYRRLIDSMKRRRFSACIAFIPWNYRRSVPRVAALVSTETNALGICVHGCDHTRGEFEGIEVEALGAKADLALKRMRAHRDLSGVPFDEVMVFPQGLFSAEALQALKTSGFLAAVNTDPCPSTGASTLRLRDLLDVATTSPGGVPLFSRRYPRNIAGFALDLFLGKPALAVEHHGYFRHGYAVLESFVEALNRLDSRLEWTTLGTICGRACLTRVSESGDVHVRLYTDRFQMNNEAAAPKRYVLERRSTSDPWQPTVTVDNRPREFRDGRLTLQPGQTADIRVMADGRLPSTFIRPDVRIRSGRVRFRRHLSEFRDNYVDTSRVLSAIVTLARFVRRESRRALAC